MPTPPRRRWFQFRLRTLLVVIAVVAIPLAWVAKERAQSRHQLQVAKQLQAQGGIRIEFCGPYDLMEQDSPRGPQGGWRQLAQGLLGERISAMHGDLPELDDLTPLAGLTKLQSLLLPQTKVRDISALRDCRDLKSLELSYAPFTDLTPLAGLIKLRYLNLGGTQVSDVTPLAAMQDLQILYLSDTHVRDVLPLAELTELRYLNLAGCQVSDLKPLAELVKLKSLDLEKNPVDDLTPLARLSQLEFVCIENTRVIDLKPLAGLANLALVRTTGSPVTTEQLDALRRALPNCNIVHKSVP